MFHMYFPPEDPKLAAKGKHEISTVEVKNLINTGGSSLSLMGMRFTPELVYEWHDNMLT